MWWCCSRSAKGWWFVKANQIPQAPSPPVLLTSPQCTHTVALLLECFWISTHNLTRLSYRPWPTAKSECLAFPHPHQQQTPLEFLTHPHPHSTKGPFRNTAHLLTCNITSPSLTSMLWFHLNFLFRNRAVKPMGAKRTRHNSFLCGNDETTPKFYEESLQLGHVSCKVLLFPKSRYSQHVECSPSSWKKSTVKQQTKYTRIHYSVTRSTFFLAMNPPWPSGCTYTDVSAAQIKNCDF